jgi:tRNA G26 N,N-dimethylase Trm1
MKTASQVKTIALNSKAQQTATELQKILGAIEKAAEVGSLRAAFKVKHNPTETIIEQLQQLGYAVSEESGLIVVDWS